MSFVCPALSRSPGRYTISKLSRIPAFEILSRKPKHKLMPEANARFQKLFEQQRQYHERMPSNMTWFPTCLTSCILCKYGAVLLIVVCKLDTILQTITVSAQTRRKTTLSYTCTVLQLDNSNQDTSVHFERKGKGLFCKSWGWGYGSAVLPINQGSDILSLCFLFLPRRVVSRNIAAILNETNRKLDAING